MHNTKHKGDEAELEALLFFKRRGFSVSLPFGENAPYDLVVEAPTGKMSRIQVRWCSWSGDRLRISLRAVSKNYCRTLDLSRIDAFLAWDGTTAYIIPNALVAGHASNICLRRVAPKNNQKKGVHLASDYKEATHFLGP